MNFAIYAACNLRRSSKSLSSSHSHKCRPYCYEEKIITFHKIIFDKMKNFQLTNVRPILNDEGLW